MIQAPGRTKNGSLDPIPSDRRRLDPLQTIPLGVSVPLEVAQPRLGPVELEAVKNPLDMVTAWDLRLGEEDFRL